MIQGKRVELSAAQRADVWCRWKAGESLHFFGKYNGWPTLERGERNLALVNIAKRARAFIVSLSNLFKSV